MKRIFVLVIFALMLMFAACSKPYPKKASYLATGSVSAYNLQYLNKQNELKEIIYRPQSAQDVWRYDFEAEEGDIVYINGKYSDSHSGLKIQLMIDGKIYKQASSEGDTVNYLVVSGVVPFND